MQRPTRPIVRFSLVLLLGGLSLTANGREPPPQRIDAKLPSGRAVSIALHRPTAALEDAVRAGDAVIAATAAGGLLRFDGADLRLTGERYEDDDGSSVVRLGRGEGETVLAGLADGRVCRVDPATLALTEIGRVPEAPTWIGWSPTAGEGKGGVVAVIRTTVHDLASGRSLDTNDKVTACLVDREGRLWVGADKGEWGGRVARRPPRPLPRRTPPADPA